MRTLVFLLLLALGAVYGCAEKNVTDADARAIADSRYLANAKAIGSNIKEVPQPTIQRRANDTVFVYIEPTTKKKITVIVDRTGKVADTVEPLANQSSR